MAVMLVLAPGEQFARIGYSAIQSFAGCTRSEILTYQALALHADPSGYCFPGRERLSSIIQLSENRISKATAGLERKGLIRKVQNVAWRVDYYLIPQQPLPLSDRLPITAPPPCHPRHSMVPPAAPRTDQRSDQRTERAATEPAVVETPEPASLSPVVLRTPEPPRPVKTPAPDEVPMDWITVGANIRPDLDAAVIQTSAAKFLDDRRSKAILLVDWTPSWKNWIRNERAPKAPVKPVVASPYSNWQAGEVAPISQAEHDPEANQRAYERHCLKLGVDPVTGQKLGPAILRPAPVAVKQEPMAAVIEPPVIEPAPEVAEPPKPKVSPLHGLLDQLRHPAPEPRQNNVPWRPVNREYLPTAEEVAEAERLLAATLAKNKGD